jgi:uncharacterized membrane protein
MLTTHDSLQVTNDSLRDGLHRERRVRDDAENKIDRLREECKYLVQRTQVMTAELDQLRAEATQCASPPGRKVARHESALSSESGGAVAKVT